MARRRKNSTFNVSFLVLVVGLAVVWVLVAAAIQNWPITIVLLAAVGGFLYLRRKQRKDREERDRIAREEAWETNRAAWRALEFEQGTYAVLVAKFVDYGAQDNVAELLSDTPTFRDRSPDEVEALVERVIHVGPQTVADGISQKSAIHLKGALELRGAKVRIKERAPRSANGSGRREAIPQRIREEVWRRDQGQCVDCDSRERLEYDHIIAVANGGSNTARNIELRCEKCNRSKGASI